MSNEAFSEIGEVQGLFRAIAAADWPKTLTRAARHNDTIGIIYVHISVLVFLNIL